MTERERLIELLREVGKNILNFPTCDFTEALADYLIANGVIVPPCKVGQSIYRIGDNGKIYGDWELVRMDIYVDEMGFIDDSDNWVALMI